MPLFCHMSRAFDRNLPEHSHYTTGETRRAFWSLSTLLVSQGIRGMDPGRGGSSRDGAGEESCGG
jgi:hypothetical protein